ncbi:hypothetical protein ACTVH1_18940 [Gluconobacter cerinus]
MPGILLSPGDQPGGGWPGVRAGRAPGRDVSRGMGPSVCDGRLSGMGRQGQSGGLSPLC